MIVMSGKISMRRSIRLGLLSLCAWVPLVCLADVGNIICTKNGMVKHVKFDTSKISVTMNGRNMKDVSITKREIRFVQDLHEAGEWAISIDRMTGTMTIKMPGKSSPGMPDSLDPLQCEKSHQKF